MSAWFLLVPYSDLGLLKRDRKLQQRYNEWAVGIKEKYGSIGESRYTRFISSSSELVIVNYLLNYRLQWGKPDHLSLLTSALDANRPPSPVIPPSLDTSDPKIAKALPDLSADAPPYFTADTPAEYISIIQNDWPYSG
jgi:hypothetical protein